MAGYGPPPTSNELARALGNKGRAGYKPHYSGTILTNPIQVNSRNKKIDRKEDAKYTRHQRATSNNSGDFYYTSNDENDAFEYTRDGSAEIIMSSGMSGNNYAYRPGVEYTKTDKRAVGRAQTGDRQPEVASRATGPDSQRGAAKKSTARGKSDRRTILTGAGGTLGGASTSKRLLGA